MSFKISALAAAVVAVATLSAAPIASAAMQTVTGTNFDLSFDDALLGNFGAINLVGNNIIFTPSDFKAISLNGEGTKITASTVQLILMTHAGFDIGSIKLLERGDYKLVGAGSSVSVEGQIRAFGLADPFTEINDFITTTAPLTTMGALTNWSSKANLSFDAASGIKQEKGVQLTLENILTANTLAGSMNTEAFIEKKFAGAGVTLEVSPVPEPETYALMLAGLGVVGMVANRRRQKQ
ncbi:hypothetical protein BH11PSE8_BH11PSE8_11750 [soil metagenome]